MKTIIFTLLISISTFSYANMDQINPNPQSVVEKSRTEIIKLTQELKEKILLQVNKKFVNAESKKFKSKDTDYKYFADLYFILSENLILCHTQSKYGDSQCFKESLKDKINDNDILETVTRTYSESIDEKETLANRIKMDLYLANYYFFISKVFSDCNISDIENRNECLKKIDFLVEQVTFN